VSIYDVTVLF